MTTIAAQYDFSGKVVVITGGSRGLGHAMALGFAGAGAKLAIASRRLDSCEAAVADSCVAGACACDCGGDRSRRGAAENSQCRVAISSARQFTHAETGRWRAGRCRLDWRETRLRR